MAGVRPVEHILTGYDHMLYLAGLILAYRQFRSIVSIGSSSAFGSEAGAGCRDVFTKMLQCTRLRRAVRLASFAGV